ncbi:hypothetical protein BZA05DRAFT_28920 [Tricharina praecox]|uniref:uncharacterized protein n=1 Tax=Tricharina praecox TaxID=43433 RepID=UPI00222071B5|nr:uncharacterized protein BZA05DRAFT_28920 [Tricharina praecox]KAI5853428.1 hypothetical protein BZA05DRAFT_28920 [Tricharina praecox]
MMRPLHSIYQASIHSQSTGYPYVRGSGYPPDFRVFNLLRTGATAHKCPKKICSQILWYSNPIHPAIQPCLSPSWRSTHLDNRRYATDKCADKVGAFTIAKLEHSHRHRKSNGSRSRYKRCITTAMFLPSVCLSILPGSLSLIPLHNFHQINLFHCP